MADWDDEMIALMIARILRDARGGLIGPNPRVWSEFRTWLMERLTREAEEVFYQEALSAGEEEDQARTWARSEALSYAQHTIAPIVQGVGRHLQSEVDRMRMAAVLGQLSADRLAQDLRRRLRGHVQDVVRTTEETRARAYARERLHGPTRWVWRAVLDERTCPECASRHGREGQWDADPPPLHPSCRCDIVPVEGG